MPKVCKINHWVIDGISIAIQVSFVFAFMTVFFFMYVHEVEKQEFQAQMTLIVDKLMDDIEDDLVKVLDKNVATSKTNTIILLNGMIDVLQEKIVMESKSGLDEVLERNYVVKLRAMKTLIYILVFVVCITIIVLLSGFCLPLSNQIKQAMLSIIFVGLTQLVFLQVITKNYISASPNRVKRSLAQTIQKWIDRKKSI